MIGERIKKIRKEKGYSQRKLSELSNVHVSQLARYESGKSKPTLETIIKIADALGVNYIELLDTVPNELLTIKKLEKALDKACEQLENLSYVTGLGQVGRNFKEWKEWCLKDE